MMFLPPPLKKGDQLIAIAPSGTLREKEKERLKIGISIWEENGYKVVLDSNYQAQDGYLAGNDTIRRQALELAWHNPEYQGILCVRGGYGGARLLENWQWQQNILSQGINDNSEGREKGRGKREEELLKYSNDDLVKYITPKWLIGFSDVTSILWSLYNQGVMSIHGAVLTTMMEESPESLKRLFNYLEGKPLPPLSGKGWGKGKARGLLLAGNLTVATHLLGTNICPNFDNVILALEDVQEAPYRIDRMLTQWRGMGILSQVKGIILGRFSGCHAPENIPSWTCEQVWSDRTKDLDIPIISEVAFGHDGVNNCLPVGGIVEINGDTGKIDFIP